MKNFISCLIMALILTLGFSHSVEAAVCRGKACVGSCGCATGSACICKVKKHRHKHIHKAKLSRCG